MTSSVGMMRFPTEWNVIEFHGSNPPTRLNFHFSWLNHHFLMVFLWKNPQTSPMDAVALSAWRPVLHPSLPSSWSVAPGFSNGVIIIISVSWEKRYIKYNGYQKKWWYKHFLKQIMIIYRFYCWYQSLIYSIHYPWLGMVYTTYIFMVICHGRSAKSKYGRLSGPDAPCWYIYHCQS